VLHHPGPYLRGCLGRLRFAVRFQPLLWAAALAFFAIGFRRQAFRQVFLFCVYFTGVHCLLAMERRYLEPLWIILSTLGAAGALSLLPSLRPPQAAQRRDLGWLAWPYLAAAGAAGLATVLCISSYPGRPLPPVEVPVSQALRRDPADAWLLHLYSRDLLRQGRAAAAASSARRAAELAPDQYPMLFDYAWALAASGQAAQQWLGRVTTGLDPAQPQYADKVCAGYMLQALWHLQAGRDRQAQAAYAQALSVWRAQPPRLRQLEAPQDEQAVQQTQRIDADLARFDTRLPDLARSLLAAWPESQRARLTRSVMDASSRMRPKLLKAPLAGRSRSKDAGASGTDALSLARQAQEHGDLWQALRLFDGLGNDRGVVYAMLGRPREAR
jgi:Tfp pilus assembly protein PilF